MEVAEFSGYTNKFKDIVSRGGPDESEYDDIKNMTLQLREMSLEDQQKLSSIIAPILADNSMIGFTFQKPHGYAGDHELIHRIYTKWKTKDEKFKKWDDLYHWADSATAVRNRKQYLIDLIAQTQICKRKSPLVLNLGSGPCTDVLEYYRQNPKSTVKFECVDMDEKSIEFASVVCDNYIESISFINQNVFRFKSNHDYDLIWSAGLFDYFNDKLFIRLLNRFYNLLNEGGQLVVGNFSENNPSRGLMEVLCQWYLYHRTESKLIELAIKAGVPKNKIKVRCESTGINLFLHLSK